MLKYNFCPICGHELVKQVPENDERERLVCNNCQHIHYLNPRPTVKGVVYRDNRILMVRRAEAPGIGGWDLPGGYLEWDEDPESGLLREIKEETGVESKIDKIIGAYHKVWKWDHAESSILNLAYRCQWVQGEAELISNHEIDQVQWVDPNNLPGWVAYGHYDQVMKDLNLS